MSDVKFERIVRELARIAAQQQLLVDLTATMFAEVASLANDPSAKLEEMISSEEGAAFAALAGTDISGVVRQNIQSDKEELRERLFRQARASLPRVLSRSA